MVFWRGGEGGQTFVLLSLILENSSRVMKMADKLLFFGSLASTHEMIFWKAYRMNTGWEGWLPEEPARLRDATLIPIPQHPGRAERLQGKLAING